MYKKVYICSRCEKVCDTKKSLDRHKENVPCDFMCENCHEKMKNRRRYNYHVKNYPCKEKEIKIIN